MIKSQRKNVTVRLLALTLVLFPSLLSLSACGGGSSSVEDVKASEMTPSSAASSTTQPPLASLNASELADAEKAALAADDNSALTLSSLKEGQVAPKSAYLSGEVARKAAASRIPVYRFYNSRTGAHFFTTSEAEKNTVMTTLSPPYNYEGAAFSVANAFSPGLSAVHRFYNTRTGVHFYTISEAERANTASYLSDYRYEGVAYYASQVAGTGLIPFYRFFVRASGFHFYTANEAEKNRIISTLGEFYTYEGIGYYVLDSDWTTTNGLPATGVTFQQCFQAGGALVPCANAGATALSPQQDGHRVNVAPMTYTTVGAYPISDCVKDAVTGLVWEGKLDDTSIRGVNTAYYNRGNGQPNDSSYYVTTVNNMNLCGFSDWRLPTVKELMSIVNYGNTSGPKINTAWFPNTASNRYWTSERTSPTSDNRYFINFSSGQAGYSGTAYLIRLVRGSQYSGPRYSYSTVAFESDAANNVVNDAWTGLQWRRCQEGRTWTGSQCLGYTTTFTHEAALAHSRNKIGWRLPNVKELGSLLDLNLSSLRIDEIAFPAPANRSWTSSADEGTAYEAWYVDFSSYIPVDHDNRTYTKAIRLVRLE